jgi:hypothetical protein
MSRDPLFYSDPAAHARNIQAERRKRARKQAREAAVSAAANSAA